MCIEFYRAPVPSRGPKGEVKVEEYRDMGITAAIAPSFRVGLTTESNSRALDLSRGVHSKLRLAGRTTPAPFEVAL